MQQNYTMTESNQFNTNNPTVNWTEDEKYELCEWEDKWLQELTRNARTRHGRVRNSVNDPTFATTEQLNDAFKKDIKERKQLYNHLCPMCDYATNCNRNIKDHLVVHGIGKPRQQKVVGESVVCQICQKEYATKENLKKHIDLIHAEKTMPCDECSKMFATVPALNKHKKEVHVSNPFNCSECNKKFKKEKSFNFHMRSVHEAPKFRCTLCDYSTNNMHHLNDHLLNDHGIEKQYNQQYKMQRFETQSKPVKKPVKKLPCQICQKEYATTKSLEEHIKLMHGEKTLPCEGCSKMFSTISALNKHTREAHAILLFKFKPEKTLKSHIRSIHENAKFRCNLCEYDAPEMENLKKHIADIHEKKELILLEE